MRAIILHDMRIDLSKVSKYILYIFLIIIAVAVLLIVFLKWSDGKSLPFIGNVGQGKSETLKKDGDTFKVSSENTPSNNKERLLAPALAIIPTRLQGLPSESSDVPYKERKQIAKLVNRFLSAWETYDPVELSVEKSKGRPSSYSDSLKKYLSPDSSSSIISREDSIDPDLICPGDSCIGGSKWRGGKYSADTIKIKDYDGSTAFITAYGLVEYTDLLKDLYNRSYGILVKKNSDNWLIVRAAAETNDRIK